MDGKLYFSENTGNRIQVVDLTTGSLSLLAGSTTAGYVDDIGAAARFNRPGAIALDEGFLLVADRSNRVVRRIDVATGEVTTLIGGRGEQAVTPGPLPARINLIGGIAVRYGGEIVVTDEEENVVLVVR